MNRQQKIEAIKKVMQGEHSPAEFIMGRLTGDEMWLIYQINEIIRKGINLNETEIKCWNYYKDETLKRPPTPEEIRGFFRNGDVDEYFSKNNFPESEEKVMFWYSELEKIGSPIVQREVLMNGKMLIA